MMSALVRKLWMLPHAKTRVVIALTSSSARCGLRLRFVGARGSSVSMSTQPKASEQLILLYENTQGEPYYFRMITLVSGIQLCFWSYLSYFIFKHLKKDDSDTREAWKDELGLEKSDSEKLQSDKKTEPNRSKWLFRFDFSSLKWRVGLSFFAMSAGVMFAVTACMYSLRMVTRISFVPTTATVHIHTFTPTGSIRVIEPSLMDITSGTDRSSKASNLSLKVQGYPLFFLVDKQNGTFRAPRLYDTLIGSRRKV